MATLPNMGLITPTLGGDSGTWDDKINAALALIDSHDHTPGKGVLVPIAGLDINDSFDMSSTYSVQNLFSLDFAAVATVNSGSKRLFVDSNDNELYWRTNAGANVKLTSGTSINTTLVGGIVGDYSSVGAEVAFDDSNKRYTFKDGSTPSNKWARLASGPVRIFEYNTTESVYVEHAVDAALAASYSVTWPAALPGATVPMQISAAGAVSFSNVFVNPPGFTTEQTAVINPASYMLYNSVGLWTSDGTGDWQTGNTTLDYLIVPVDVLRSGERIKGFTVRLSKFSDNTNTITAVLKKRTMSAETTIGTGTNAENATGNNRTIVVTGLTEAFDTAYKYFILITQSDGTPSATDVIGSTLITFDRPA